MVSEKEKIACPICNDKINNTSRAKGLHAQKHGISSEELYVKLYCNGVRPTCECRKGCESFVHWSGWKDGFDKLVHGHFTEEQITKRTQTRIQNLKEGKHIHWTQKEENKETLKKIASKVSESLCEGFATSRIKHWAKGKTKYNHSSLATRSQKLAKKMSRAGHWNWDYAHDVDAKILPILGENFSFESFEKTDINTKCQMFVTCKRCGFRKETTLYNVIRHKENAYSCHRCDHSQSKAETEIAEFVTSVVGHENVIRGDRAVLASPQEIDIWVPNCNFAIEFNGLYWHSEVNVDKSFHQLKTDRCKQHNVFLLHIFEDEWRDRPEIVKSMILHRLNKTSRKFFARKCKIEMLPLNKRRNFFNASHIDGDARATVAFGLILDDEVVAAISLCNFPSKQTAEIARFAIALNTSVPGAFQRLLVACEKWCQDNCVQKLITYADLRHGTGYVYEKAGFERLPNTTERFWWTDCENRFDRRSVVADKQNGITERDIAVKKRVFRIYGCKNASFMKKIKKLHHN